MIYEAKGKPYLVMSKKDESGQKHQFYKLENLKQLYNIPTDKLKNGDIAIIKKNGNFNKFIWVVEDGEVCGKWVSGGKWTSCEEFNWETKENKESEIKKYD